MPKYLVTGGAGFIGSHLARTLLERGNEVWVVDNLATGRRHNVPAEAKFVELDLSKPESFNALPEEPFEAVLQLAAQSSGEISFDNPVYDLQTNVLGTLLLLRWCHEHGITRFLYASSMSIYGEVEQQPVSEEAQCRPKSFYGVGKLAGEQYLRIFTDYGIRTTAFRMFNVYGPGQNLDNLKQGMLSIYLAYLLRGEPLIVRGSRERFRDLVYVDDVVAAWLAALETPASWGKTYNLGSGTRTHVWELVEKLLDALQLGADYPVSYAEGTPGDQFGMYADISLIERELDWRPKVSLQQGIARTVAWARQLRPMPT